MGDSGSYSQSQGAEPISLMQPCVHCSDNVSPQDLSAVGATARDVRVLFPLLHQSIYLTDLIVASRSSRGLMRVCYGSYAVHVAGCIVYGPV